MSPFDILLISPSLEGVGGVSVFAQMLMDHIGPEFRVEHFTVANRPGNRRVLKQLLFFYKDAKHLKKKLEEKTYDVIHLNPSFRPLALPRDTYYLSRISKFKTAKTLVMFHGWDEAMARKIARNPFFRRLFMRTYKKARLILVLCRSFRQQLLDLGMPSSKIDVVTTMYQKDRDSLAVERERGDRRVRFLFMARLLRAKGPYVAAEAVKLLVENGYTDIRFVMAGEGPEFKGLSRYIKKQALEDYVRMPGIISGEKKKKILAESDILLLPSSSEGCPIAILEAMGAGMAVIARPVGAIPDIVESGKNGFLVESGEAHPFYEAARQLIQDKELLKRMQSENRQKAEAHYEVKAVVKEIESLYRSVAHEG
jgi:glycosyltransferase involved in cell wall biosynthesis